MASFDPPTLTPAGPARLARDRTCGPCGGEAACPLVLTEDRLVTAAGVDLTDLRPSSLYVPRLPSRLRHQSGSESQAAVRAAARAGARLPSRGGPSHGGARGGGRGGAGRVVGVQTPARPKRTRVLAGPRIRLIALPWV